MPESGGSRRRLVRLVVVVCLESSRRRMPFTSPWRIRRRLLLLARSGWRGGRVREILALAQPSGARLVVHPRATRRARRSWKCGAYGACLCAIWTPPLHNGQVSTKAGQLHRLLFQLFDLYEDEQLPLRRLASVRSLSIWLRRWREPLDLVWAFTKLGVLRQPVKSLYSPDR